MRNIVYLFILITLIQTNNLLNAQDIKVEGYAFESDDRGYLNFVTVDFYESGTNQLVTKVFSNTEGFFSTSLPAGKSFELRANKDLFFERVQSVSTTSENPIIYLKVQMEREPGYILDVTMAQKSDSLDGEVDAIVGSRIDIFNNTQEREELVLEDYPHINFQYTLKKGNHYTILIRQKGYLAKRIEAYVNVNGCIVCIDGVGSINPGVSDNLTQGFDMGTLLANVELDKVNFDKVYTLSNIYYDLDKATLKPEAKVELDNLITILKDNPTISIELGSHTDARGRDKYNLKLSQKRAESASTYLINQGNINVRRIIAKGYGESELVNNCTNGIDCSETEHQKNRRTEFKVLEQSEESEYISLSEIKRLEKMDELFKEVQNQEIVELKPGEEIPEDLRRQLEKDRSKERKNRIRNKKTDKQKVVEKAHASDLNTASKTIDDALPINDTVNEVTENIIRDVTKESYTGYLVKVYVSKERLTQNSPRLNGLSDIWEQKVTENLYYYFMGTFAKRDHADNVYKQLEGNCAVCSVVKFENGLIRL